MTERGKTHDVAEHEGGEEEEVDDPHDVDPLAVQRGCGQGRIADNRPVGQDSVSYCSVQHVDLGTERVSTAPQTQENIFKNPLSMNPS